MPNGWPTVTIHLDGKTSLTEQEQIIETTEVEQVAQLHSLARALPEKITNIATFERVEAPQKLGQLAIREISTAHTLEGVKSAELAQGRRFVLDASIYVEGHVTHVAVFRKK